MATVNRSPRHLSSFSLTLSLFSFSFLPRSIGFLFPPPSQEEREAKSNKRADKDEKYRAKEAEREAREREEREALQALREEQEAKDNEEFAKWKDMFTVESEGTVEQEIRAESQGLLQEFIDHIVSKKVVVLEAGKWFHSPGMTCTQ